MRQLAVIFDMDGTLLDTERFYSAAFAAAAREFGLAMHPALHDAITGLASPDRVAVLRREWGAGFPASDFLHRYRAIRAALLPERIPLCPGADALVRALAARGVRLAVATSASRQTAQAHLARAGIAHRISQLVTRDDVAQGKPAPDVYVEALRRLGLRAAHCIAIEDSTHGEVSARAAGLACLRVGKGAAFPDLTAAAEALGLPACNRPQPAALSAKLRAMVPAP